MKYVLTIFVLFLSTLIMAQGVPPSTLGVDPDPRLPSICFDGSLQAALYQYTQDQVSILVNQGIVLGVFPDLASAQAAAQAVAKYELAAYCNQLQSFNDHRDLQNLKALVDTLKQRVCGSGPC